MIGCYFTYVSKVVISIALNLTRTGDVYFYNMFNLFAYSRLCIVCAMLLCATQANAYQKSDSMQIRLLINRGIQLYTRNPDSALILLHAGLQQSERINSFYGIGAAVSYIAMVYTNGGMYEKAIRELTDVLAYCKSTHGQERNVPCIYDMIGTIYKMGGNYNEALAYYNNALLANQQLSLPATPDLYNNLGAALMALHRWQQASFYLSKAEQAGRKMNDYDVVGYSLMNLGLILENQKKTTMSMYYYDSALKISRAYNLPHVQYLTLTNVASLYLSEHKPQTALSYLSKTQSIKGNISPYNKAIFYGRMAQAYAQLHKYDNAEKYYLKILKLSDSAQIRQHVQSAYEGLSEIYTQTGKYKKALDEYKKSMVLKDSIENQGIVNNLNQLDVKYRTSEKDKQLTENQLQLSRQESSLRQKNLWIACISFAAFLFILLYRIKQHKERLQQQKIKTMEREHELGQLKAMMKGEENERNRLARELHDGIGGMLSSINMNLNVIQARHSEIANIEKLDEVVQMLQDTSSEVRKTAHNLMPDILVRHNLKDALAIYCGNVKGDGNLQINLHYDDTIVITDKTIELVIYRIIQELLQNVVKHARATIADIQLLLNDNILAIIVEDNGIGFNVTEQQSGYGLQNLKYRVQALHGNISIMAEHGTTMHIEFDLEKLRNSVTI